MFWSILSGFIGIGLLARMAVQRGEVKFNCTEEELAQLARRGRMILAILWIPTGLTLAALLEWASGVSVASGAPLLILILAAGIPAGLLAWGLNSALEHTGFRIVYPHQRRCRSGHS